MKNPRIIAFAGIISALSVLLLFLGSVIWVLGYIMPIVVSILMIVLVKSVSKKSAILTYVSTSVLSIILLSEKETALLYILFFGYYPIIKNKLDAISSKVIKLIVKLVIYNISVAITQVLCIYVFGIPFDAMFGKWGILLYVFLMNFIFVFYDRLYDAMTKLYIYKLKNRIEKYIK